MNERAARDVALVHAIESTDTDRVVWSDADRALASRAAAEKVGAGASSDEFLAERAALVLTRIARRHPKVQTLARSAPARAWLMPLVGVAAFVVGALGADVGPAQRVNLLAPPVLALIAWNLAVYLVLAGSLLVRRSATVAEGPLRRTVAAWLRDTVRRVPKTALPAPLALAVGRFAAEWPLLASRLWHQRAARLLHEAAAALAAGAIAGLYLRGIVLEYRASWQSTFLDATDVARVLHIVLAPGAWLTGIALPDAQHIAALGAGSAGENAGSWIHLYAATILLTVIIPRVALATVASLRERALVQRFPMSLELPYFRRLLGAWRQGSARVAAVPYSYTVPPARTTGLARIVTRALESPVDIDWLPSVPYGSDDLPVLQDAPLAAVLVIFNLNATPERENHAAFTEALAARVARTAPLVAIVDTSDFVERFGAATQRIAERQANWQRALAGQPLDIVFARLADPDVQATSGALAAFIERVPA